MINSTVTAGPLPANRYKLGDARKIYSKHWIKMDGSPVMYTKRVKRVNAEYLALTKKIHLQVIEVRKRRLENSPKGLRRQIRQGKPLSIQLCRNNDEESLKLPNIHEGKLADIRGLKHTKRVKINRASDCDSNYSSEFASQNSSDYEKPED